MRLSLHSDYALRVLMALAATGRQMSVDEIARQYGISRHHLAKVAPRDGTVFGAVNSALLLDTLIAGPNSRAQFKAPDMSMLGSISSNASMLIATRASGVKSIDDIRARGVVLGATALSSDSYLSALAFKKALGLDAMKIIPGYPGTRELTLAMERG